MLRKYEKSSWHYHWILILNNSSLTSYPLYDNIGKIYNGCVRTDNTKWEKVSSANLNRNTPDKPEQCCQGRVFGDNLGIIFLFLRKNICCGYSLEVPRWGASNEYPQHMLLWRTGENYPWIIVKYSSLTNLLLNACTISTLPSLFINII